MKTGHVALCLLPFVLVALLVAAFAAPPEPLGENAPNDVFSAGRAMAHVRGLTSTGKPHPAAHYDGSARTPEEIADHDRARDWVMSSLRNLGLEPVIQKGNACGRFTCADVENVVARWDVGSPGPALVLMAHYDSTPFGPGAADDGAGVATLLETVRALKAGPPPKRPLIIVIDDGEEMGLLGARVLMKDHPWLNEMELFLNFEARGTSGQVAMFETSSGNGALIDTFASSVKRPVASSVIYTLYKRLPNDTDLSIVKQAGKQGLNFAFADHVYNYHTAKDTETELNLGSLQHMGDQSLALSRAFLTAESLPKPTSDSAYFDLFSLVLVHYPENVSGALALLGAILALVGMGSALRKKRTSIGRLALAMAVVLGSLVVGAITGVGLGALLKGAVPKLGNGAVGNAGDDGRSSCVYPVACHCVHGSCGITRICSLALSAR
ncbi:MAG: M20/M25/M40 family metallo-hydrolase [Polyangiaceae bacterium]|nr:M20/M25/M40 family metallo-hydrolase [Polyangiaceae bacterium]